MIPGFYKSKYWERLMNGVQGVEKRGAKESGIMLVTGEPGVGKTEAIKRLAATVDSMYIRVPSVVNKKGLMCELSRTDPVLPTKGTVLDIQNAIKQYILDHNKILILDECQHLIKDTAEMLEAIRDITDATQCMCILVAGEADVQARIARYPQFARRINRSVDFQRLSLAEIPALLKAKCEITLDDDLIEEFHRQSLGVMRMMCNGMAVLEQFAKRNRKDSLSLADITIEEGGVKKPLQICTEWTATSKTRVRP
jgi:type II secretory pathway predicted ATPase ExeA